MESSSGAQQVSGDEKKKRKRLKKLQGEVRQQIEFYFSDANLRKDRFLKQEIAKAENGYIHIATLATFNKVRKMTADLGLIAKSLEKSETIEVSEDKTKIRRKKPLEESKYDIDDLTVYVENLPRNVDHDMLRKAFNSCGTVAYISLPRYKTTGDPKRFAFIEFTTPKEAARACKLLNNPPRSKPNTDGHFPTTRKGRLILPEQPAGLRAQRDGQPLARRGHDHRPERKRAASETEVTLPDAERDRASAKKKKAKRVDPPSVSDGKPSLKRKRPAEGAGAPARDEEPIDNKAKRKKDAPSDQRDQDGHKESRKRKHSGSEDSPLKHERSPQGDDQSRKLKGERSESKGDRSESRGDRTASKDNRSESKGDRSKSKVERSASKENRLVSKETRSECKSDESESRGQRSEDASKSSRSDACPKEERKEKRRVAGSEVRKRKRDDTTSSVDDPKVKKLNSEHASRKDEEGAESERGSEGKKKKKSRSRKHKKEDEEPVTMLQLRVIPKKDWLVLKQEYLVRQKAGRQQMKQALRGQGQGPRQQEPADQWMEGTDHQHQESETKLKSTEPEFVPGVVLKVSSRKPFASRKDLREQLQEISPVAYVELNDGETGGFVRFKSADGAKAVIGKSSSITNDQDQVQINLLAGQEETEYWDKLKADRIAKLSSKTKKRKKRGVQRILTKTEKLLGSEKTKKSHIIFDD